MGPHKYVVIIVPVAHLVAGRNAHCRRQLTFTHCSVISSNTPLLILPLITTHLHPVAMLAVRTLRPLSQAPRLARARLNSSAAARPVHPESASHGKTLLIIGVSTAAAVAGVTVALDMRRSHGRGAEVKEAAGEAVSAAQDKVEDLKSGESGSAPSGEGGSEGGRGLRE